MNGTAFCRTLNQGVCAAPRPRPNKNAKDWGVKTRTSPQVRLLVRCCVALATLAGLSATMTRRLRGVILSMIVGFAPFAAAPVPSEASTPNFHYKLWNQRDGAQASLGPMVQTTDGYLRQETANGLFRLDALHFEEIDLPGHPGLRAAEVYSLLPTPDGRPWIGYTRGGAALSRDGQATLYPQAEGLPLGAAYQVVPESDGTISAHSNARRPSSSGWNLRTPVPASLSASSTTDAAWTTTCPRKQPRQDIGASQACASALGASEATSIYPVVPTEARR